MPYHLYLHVEALSWKEEAICEYDVETPIFSGQKPHVKMTETKWKTVLWPEK